MTWHVFSTNPNTEYATAQAIRDLGLTAYVPTETIERTRGHKATTIRQPALRGYVFVECDQGDWSKISPLEGFCSWIWATLPDGSRKPATVPPSGLADDPTNIRVLCGDCHAAQHPEIANMIARPRRRSGVLKDCPVCGQAFYTKKSHAKLRTHCSRKCRHSPEARGGSKPRGKG